MLFSMHLRKRKIRRVIIGKKMEDKFDGIALLHQPTRKPCNTMISSSPSREMQQGVDRFITSSGSVRNMGFPSRLTSAAMSEVIPRMGI